MAHNRNTIVKHMIEVSGKANAEIASLIDKTEDYVEHMIDGSVRPTVNVLVSLASQCGFSVVFENGADRMELAPMLIPKPLLDHR